MSRESKIYFFWTDNAVASFIGSPFQMQMPICGSEMGVNSFEIVESYPKANEESKDFPILKNSNCIVFFTIYASSLIKNLFCIEMILCSHQQNCSENHFVADIVLLCTTQKSVASQLLPILKVCSNTCFKCQGKPYPVCIL